MIGLGTDSFSEADRNAVREEIAKMHQLGGTVIDTAAAYGDSEALIGEALESLGTRDRMFLATKMSGGASRGTQDFAHSLERLKTGRIDLLQVHNLYGTAELLAQMQQWKQQGRIRYVGVTTSRGGQHAELAETMRRYPLDFIQVD